MYMYVRQMAYVIASVHRNRGIEVIVEGRMKKSEVHVYHLRKDSRGSRLSTGVFYRRCSERIFFVSQTALLFLCNFESQRR